MGLWTRLLPFLAIPISKAGVTTGSNQENVERTLLCHEYNIKFFGQWFRCVILVSFCTCDNVHTTCKTDY